MACGGTGVTCEELLFGADYFYFYLNFSYFVFWFLFELHTRTVMEARQKKKRKTLVGYNKGLFISGLSWSILLQTLNKPNEEKCLNRAKAPPPFAPSQRVTVSIQAPNDATQNRTPCVKNLNQGVWREEPNLHLRLMDALLRFSTNGWWIMGPKEGSTQRRGGAPGKEGGVD